MKHFNTIRALEPAHPIVAQRLREVLQDYCDHEELDVNTEELDILVGGDITEHETQAEADEMVRDFGDMPDIVDHSIEGITQVIYLTNNAGGPTFIFPQELYDLWIIKQTGALMKNYREAWEQMQPK